MGNVGAQFQTRMDRVNGQPLRVIQGKSDGAERCLESEELLLISDCEEIEGIAEKCMIFRRREGEFYMGVKIKKSEYQARQMLSNKPQLSFEERIKLFHVNLFSCLKQEIEPTTPTPLQSQQQYSKSPQMSIAEPSILLTYEFNTLSLESLIGDRLQSNRLFPEDDLMVLCRSILSVLAYLQVQGVAHGDIHPSSIFYRASAGVFSVYDRDLLGGRCLGMRLADSGQKFSYLSPEAITLLRSGSTVFTANEIIAKSDVFSLGMTLLEAASLRLSQECYDAEYSIISNVIAERLEFLSQYYSPDFCEILALMIEFDVNNRLDPGALLRKIDKFQDASSEVLDQEQAHQFPQQTAFATPASATPNRKQFTFSGEQSQQQQQQQAIFQINNNNGYSQQQQQQLQNQLILQETPNSKNTNGQSQYEQQQRESQVQNGMFNTTNQMQLLQQEASSPHHGSAINIQNQSIAGQFPPQNNKRPPNKSVDSTNQITKITFGQENNNSNASVQPLGGGGNVRRERAGSSYSVSQEKTIEKSQNQYQDFQKDGSIHNFSQEVSRNNSNNRQILQIQQIQQQQQQPQQQQQSQTRQQLLNQQSNEVIPIQQLNQPRQEFQQQYSTMQQDQGYQVQQQFRTKELHEQVISQQQQNQVPMHDSSVQSRSPQVQQNPQQIGGRKQSNASAQSNSDFNPSQILQNLAEQQADIVNQINLNFALQAKQQAEVAEQLQNRPTAIKLLKNNPLNASAKIHPNQGFSKSPSDPSKNQNSTEKSKPPQVQSSASQQPQQIQAPGKPIQQLVDKQPQQQNSQQQQQRSSSLFSQPSYSYQSQQSSSKQQSGGKGFSVFDLPTKQSTVMPANMMGFSASEQQPNNQQQLVKQQQQQLVASEYQQIQYEQEQYPQFEEEQPYQPIQQQQSQQQSHQYYQQQHQQYSQQQQVQFQESSGQMNSQFIVPSHPQPTQGSIPKQQQTPLKQQNQQAPQYIQQSQLLQPQHENDWQQQQQQQHWQQQQLQQQQEYSQHMLLSQQKQQSMYQEKHPEQLYVNSQNRQEAVMPSPNKQQQIRQQPEQQQQQQLQYQAWPQTQQFTYQQHNSSLLQQQQQQYPQQAIVIQNNNNYTHNGMNPNNNTNIPMNMIQQTPQQSVSDSSFVVFPANIPSSASFQPLQQSNSQNLPLQQKQFQPHQIPPALPPINEVFPQALPLGAKLKEIQVFNQQDSKRNVMTTSSQAGFSTEQEQSFQKQSDTQSSQIFELLPEKQMTKESRDMNQQNMQIQEFQQQQSAAQMSFQGRPNEIAKEFNNQQNNPYFGENSGQQQQQQQQQLTSSISRSNKVLGSIHQTPLSNIQDNAIKGQALLLQSLPLPQQQSKQLQFSIQNSNNKKPTSQHQYQSSSQGQTRFLAGNQTAQTIQKSSNTPIPLKSRQNNSFVASNYSPVPAQQILQASAKLQQQAPQNRQSSSHSSYIPSVLSSKDTNITPGNASITVNISPIIPNGSTSLGIQNDRDQMNSFKPTNNNNNNGMIQLKHLDQLQGNSITTTGGDSQLKESIGQKNQQINVRTSSYDPSSRIDLSKQFTGSQQTTQSPAFPVAVTSDLNERVKQVIARSQAIRKNFE